MSKQFQISATMPVTLTVTATWNEDGEYTEVQSIDNVDLPILGDLLDTMSPDDCDELDNAYKEASDG